MRVIAGSAKGRRLVSVPGTGTRPITDRAKEALFSILAAETSGARFLDLFAGTGQVGIEALSRGAAHVDFVERASQAVAIIRENLRRTGLADRATVFTRDVFVHLDGAPPAMGYQVVYVAPPQYKGLWDKTLSALDAAPDWVAPDGVVIVQIDPREAMDLNLMHFTAADERRYGGVLLRFYAKVAANPE